MSAEPKVYHAIRSVKASIDPDARDEYLGQVKAFAQAFGFNVRFSQTSPYPNDIMTHMERHDVWMTGGPVSKLGASDLAYEFAFYAHANRPVSAAALDPVVDGLRNFLGQIKGAVVTETTPRS
jgi:hypothetical protein